MNHSRLLSARLRATSTLLALALGGCALTFTPRAFAQATAYPPDRMAYQGYLVDANGTALGTNAPKNYDVIFRIWNDSSATAAGNRLWTEQQTVTVDKGYFSVLLGEGSSIGEARPVLSTVFTNLNSSDRWVGLTVKGIGAGNTDVTLLPRLRLITSPYSFLAAKAMSVDGAAVTGGTVADARLTTNVALLTGSQTFSGAKSFTNAGNSFTGNGGGLTNLNASQLSSNIVAFLAGSQTFSGAKSFANAGNSFTGNGGGLTNLINLNASQLTSGTVADARLSTNVALRNVTNTFSANQYFTTNAWLGLGTVTPRQTLDVTANTTTNNGITIENLGTGNPQLRFMSNNVAQFAMTYVKSSKRLSLYSAADNSDVLNIHDSGAVTIGTTTTSGSLHIRHPGSATYTWPIRVSNPASTVSHAGIRVNDGGFLDLTSRAEEGGGASWARLNGNGTWSQSSDRRLKEAIQPLNGVLAKALALQPISFRYKNHAPKPGEADEIGFVAQEVEPLFPSLICDGEYKFLNYSGFGVVAIAAIQELNQQVQADNQVLRGALAVKDAELADIQDRLAALEELVRKSLAGPRASK